MALAVASWMGRCLSTVDAITQPLENPEDRWLILSSFQFALTSRITEFSHLQPIAEVASSESFLPVAEKFLSGALSNCIEFSHPPQPIAERAEHCMSYSPLSLEAMSLL